jgi:hypothetical protein
LTGFFAGPFAFEVAFEVVLEAGFAGGLVFFACFVFATLTLHTIYSAFI